MDIEKIDESDLIGATLYLWSSTDCVVKEAIVKSVQRDNGKVVRLSCSIQGRPDLISFHPKYLYRDYDGALQEALNSWNIQDLETLVSFRNGIESNYDRTLEKVKESADEMSRQAFEAIQELAKTYQTYEDVRKQYDPKESTAPFPREDSELSKTVQRLAKAANFRLHGYEDRLNNWWGIIKTLNEAEHLLKGGNNELG